MRLIDEIPVFGVELDEAALAQIKTCAFMADHHKGYVVPIGGANNRYGTLHAENPEFRLANRRIDRRR